MKESEREFKRVKKEREKKKGNGSKEKRRKEWELGNLISRSLLSKLRLKL